MMKQSHRTVFVFLSLLAVAIVFSVLVLAPTQNVTAAGEPQTGIETCNTCHEQAYTPWSTSNHNKGNVSCLVCHKLGQGEGTHPFQLKYTVESEDVTCGVCHTEVYGKNVAGQVELSYHGKIGLKCISCHEPHSQGPKLAPGSKVVCENCHKKEMETVLKSTHMVAGLSCVNCHMGPERSHTEDVAEKTCVGCHADIHQSGRFISAGLKIRTMATPAAVFEELSPPAEPQPQPNTGGISLPSWTLLLAGLLVGGIGTWALIGKDPGKPNL
jgi:hypothetical protein